MSATPSEDLIIRLEFVDADPGAPDPAERLEVSELTRSELRAQGYEVADAYTGAKSPDALDAIARFVYENNTTLFAMTSQLATVLGLLAAIRRKPEAPRSVQPDVRIVLPPVQVSVSLEAPIAADSLLGMLLNVDPDLPNKVTVATRPTVQVAVAQRPPIDL